MYYGLYGFRYGILHCLGEDIVDGLTVLKLRMKLVEVNADVDFSVVGEQLGFKGKFGPLYTYGIKALEKYHPYWFLAENVGGLKKEHHGRN